MRYCATIEVGALNVTEFVKRVAHADRAPQTAKADLVARHPARDGNRRIGPAPARRMAVVTAAKRDQHAPARNLARSRELPALWTSPDMRTAAKTPTTRKRAFFIFLPETQAFARGSVPCPPPRLARAGCLQERAAGDFARDKCGIVRGSRENAQLLALDDPVVHVAEDLLQLHDAFDRRRCTFARDGRDGFERVANPADADADTMQLGIAWMIAQARDAAFEAPPRPADESHELFSADLEGLRRNRWMRACIAHEREQSRKSFSVHFREQSGPCELAPLAHRLNDGSECRAIVEWQAIRERFDVPEYDIRIANQPQMFAQPAKFFEQHARPRRLEQAAKRSQR